MAIANRSYKELMHKVPSSKRLHYETLVEECGDRIPLYMFYNHQSVAGDAHFVGKLPTVDGVNLAFANDIAHLLDLKAAAACETPARRLDHK